MKSEIAKMIYRNRISIAPYGRNFRGAGGSSDQCSQFSRSLIEQKVLSLDLKADRKSLMRTVCGSEFQTDGARLFSLFSWTVGPLTGWQKNVKFGCRQVLRFGGWVDVLRTLYVRTVKLYVIRCLDWQPTQLVQQRLDVGSSRRAYRWPVRFYDPGLVQRGPAVVNVPHRWLARVIRFSWEAKLVNISRKARW